MTGVQPLHVFCHAVRLSCFGDQVAHLVEYVEENTEAIALGAEEAFEKTDVLAAHGVRMVHRVAVANSIHIQWGPHATTALL